MDSASAISARKVSGRAQLQPVAQQLGLFLDADGGAVKVGEADLGGCGFLGLERGLGQAGELLRGVPPEQLRQQRREVALQRDLPRIPAGLKLEGGPHHARHLLERLVLQQPGEEQVAGFEQRDVFLVLHFAGGQEPGRLEVQQGGGDDEEFAGLIKGPFLAQLLEVP